MQCNQNLFWQIWILLWRQVGKFFDKHPAPTLCCILSSDLMLSAKSSESVYSPPAMTMADKASIMLPYEPETWPIDASSWQTPGLRKVHQGRQRRHWRPLAATLLKSLPACILSAISQESFFWSFVDFCGRRKLFWVIWGRASPCDITDCPTLTCIVVAHYQV